MIFYPKKLGGASLIVTDNSEVKFVATGNIKRYTIMQYRCRESYIKLLPDGQYMDRRTGEVKDRKFKAKTRSDNINNVRKSMQRGRDLINTNITSLDSAVWITFTYAENITDPKQLYKDWKIFNTLYRRKIGPYKYIIAVEPQQRGAWHIHAFLIFDGGIPYIDYNLIRNTWGHGRVEVQELYGDVDNLGAYVSAYLCNLDLQSHSQQLGYHDLNIVTCNRDGISKQYIKGQRISMYPSNMFIFRHSKDLLKPEEIYIPLEEAIKKVRSDKRTFEKYTEAEIKTKTGSYINIIYTQYYNTTSSDCQDTISKK